MLRSLFCGFPAIEKGNQWYLLNHGFVQYLLLKPFLSMTFRNIINQHDVKVVYQYIVL